MTKSVTAVNDKVILSMIQGFRTLLYAVFGRHEQGADYAIAVGDSLCRPDSLFYHGGSRSILQGTVLVRHGTTMPMTQCRGSERDERGW